MEISFLYGSAMRIKMRNRSIGFTTEVQIDGSSSDAGIDYIDRWEWDLDSG